jgi:hypothetical protein
MGKLKYDLDCKKVILLMAVILIAVFLLPSFSASQIFKQENNVDLKIQCIINGTYCSSGAFCNLTVQYPNGSLLISNKKMTNQNSFYNYTLPTTSTIGTYLCSTTCCDGGLCGTGNDCDFILTPSGFEVSTGQSIIYIIAIVFSSVIFFLLLYASLIIPFKNFTSPEGKIISVNNFKFLKIGAIAGCYMMLMFLFKTLDSLSTNFMYSGSSSKIFEWLYSIMLAMIYPTAIAGIVLGFAVFINDIYVKKKLQRRYWR